MQRMLRYTLRQLEYLVACVDTGSLVAAAAKLNVSQPSVSAAIAKLEDEVGVQLLIRHHAQGVVPSASAEPLLRSARNLLFQAQDFQQSAAATGNTVAGALNLGSFISLAPAYLPGLIAQLRSTHPELHLRLNEGTQSELVNELRQGHHHAALLYDIGLPDDLQRTELAKVEPHVLLPEKHLLARKTMIALRDLDNEPLILLDVPPSREYFTGLLETAGIEPRVAFTSPSLELVRGLVGRGLGYSLLVTRPPSDLTYDGQRLAIRKLKGPVEKSRIVLCRLDAIRPTLAMSAFEQLAVAYFADLSDQARVPVK